MTSCPLAVQMLIPWDMTELEQCFWLYSMSLIHSVSAGKNRHLWLECIAQSKWFSGWGAESPFCVLLCQFPLSLTSFCKYSFTQGLCPSQECLPTLSNVFLLWGVTGFWIPFQMEWQWDSSTDFSEFLCFFPFLFCTIKAEIIISSSCSQERNDLPKQSSDIFNCIVLLQRPLLKLGLSSEQ